MQSIIPTIEEYFSELPENRKEAMQQLRQTILAHLPEGFSEVMGYGMPGYVVSHSVYPSGYHCNPKEPLPFMGFASQKNYISFYHMGIYADPELMQWFLAEYASFSRRKPDIGKSCIRFKKMEEIPFELIGKLVSRMTVPQWIEIYEKQLKKQN